MSIMVEFECLQGDFRSSARIHIIQQHLGSHQWPLRWDLNLRHQMWRPDVLLSHVVACCRICQVTAQDEVTGEDSTVLMLQDCEDDPVGISDP